MCAYGQNVLTTFGEHPVEMLVKYSEIFSQNV